MNDMLLRMLQALTDAELKQLRTALDNVEQHRNCAPSRDDSEARWKARDWEQEFDCTEPDEECAEDEVSYEQSTSVR